MANALTTTKTDLASTTKDAPPSDPPPPYSGIRTSSIPMDKLPEGWRDQKATLECIFVALSRERVLPSILGISGISSFNMRTIEAEQERMYNFMVYTLAVDYRCNTSLGLVQTPEDRDFFAAMGRWFIRMYGGWKDGKLSFDSPEDMRIQRPYLLRNVHTPAYNVGIPIDVLAVMAMRHMRAVERYGEYQSCVEDVLQEDGIARLAEKVYLDGKLVTARSVRDRTARESLQAHVRATSRCYFLALGPPTRATKFRKRGREWAKGRRVPFTLNEDSKGYEVSGSEVKKRMGLVGWLKWLGGALRGKPCA